MQRKIGVAAALALALCTGACGQQPSDSAAVSDASSPVWNFERVGAAVDSTGALDRASYSKLAPWPDVHPAHIIYSGCYDPAALMPELNGRDRCFLALDVSDPDHPKRIATVYAFDREASPPPPPDSDVWQKDYPFPDLPVAAPCNVDWSDPDITAGHKPPPCWDPGWNTHNHYVSRGPGALLAVNQEGYRGGTNRQANYHGVKFYDVSDPTHPKFLSYWEAPASAPDPATGGFSDSGGVHHFNFAGGYLYLGGEYEGYIGKILVILDLSDPVHPKEAGKWWIPGQKTPEEDSVRDWQRQPAFSSPIVKLPNGLYTKHVGMHYVTIYGDTAYLFYHQAGLVILDVADKAHPKLLSRTHCLQPYAEPNSPDVEACRAAAGGRPAACGNSHSSKLVPGRPNLLVVTDEYFTCPYGHMRIFDVTDKTHPVVLSHFTTSENTHCDPSHPQEAADARRFPRRGPSSHIGNAWGANLYFLAWYGMGLRAIDLTDPTKPVEVGHYEYDLGDDYGNGNPQFAGSDTYDVIFGPEGRLYVADGTADLRVLRYTGPGGGPGTRKEPDPIGP